MTKQKTISTVFVITFCGLLTLFQGCSSDTEKGTTNESVKTSPSQEKPKQTTTSQDDYATVDVGTGTGNLNGMVKFTGNVPNAQKFQVAKDPNTCGSGTREIQEVNVGAGGGLSGAVVYLEGVEGGKEFDKPAGGYVLNQEGCRFVPHLSVVPKGADVSIVNNDPVMHNIHTYQIMGKVRRSMFNISQPKQNQKITKTIDPKHSNVIKVECDAHNFMHAWIFTVDNPYYAITDAFGSFTISDIPVGKYTLKIWNPTLKIMEKEIAIVGGKDNSISVEMTE